MLPGWLTLLVLSQNVSQWKSTKCEPTKPHAILTGLKKTKQKIACTCRLHSEIGADERVKMIRVSLNAQQKKRKLNTKTEHEIL